MPFRLVVLPFVLSGFLLVSGPSNSQEPSASISFAVFSEEHACGPLGYEDSSSCITLTKEKFNNLVRHRYNILQSVDVPPPQFPIKSALRNMIVDYTRRMQLHDRSLAMTRHRSSLVLRMEWQDLPDGIRIRRYEEGDDGRLQPVYCYPRSCNFKAMTRTFFFHAPLEHFDRGRDILWTIELRQGDNLTRWEWPIGFPGSLEEPTS